MEVPSSSHLRHLTLKTPRFVRKGRSMKRSRLLTVLVVGLGVVALLAACSSSSSDNSGSSGTSVFGPPPRKQRRQRASPQRYRSSLSPFDRRS